MLPVVSMTNTNAGICFTLKSLERKFVRQQSKVEYYTNEIRGTYLSLWEIQELPINSFQSLPEECFRAHSVSEVSQYTQGGLHSQISSLHMEIMVRGEDRGGAVLVDAPFGPHIAATVQNTSMTAFA